MDERTVACDVLIVGGGLGGCAAALAACRHHQRVCLTEETHWLGGQATSQGVAVLDEHAHIEHCGATASYRQWRDLIRSHYRDGYTLTPEAAAEARLNPGAGWVSRLCFEPRVGMGALVQMLLPYVAAGQLEIFYQTCPLAVQRDGTRIHQVTCQQAAYQRRLHFRPAYVLDATELGDLLPLADIPHVTGAESRDQTGEPHARATPAPALSQRFTLPFAVDFCPGQDHTVPRPPEYERNRDHQPFTLTLRYGTRDLTYKVFAPVEDLPGSFWTYRRLLAAELFAPGQVAGDIALINWDSNDFGGGDLVTADAAQRQQLIEAAKNLSLGFLHWLQTEVPRDDGQGRGYPEIRLRRDVMGTDDGFAQYPYVRESRRIQALTTIREQDVSAAFQDGARAALFADSVGVGWYPIDIHGLAGDETPGGPTKPFQIPLGALIPQGADNLLAACKNIGTTHITNGCYRLHPIEWNIGEAAGELAAYCLGQGCTPAQVHSDQQRLRHFQRQLLDAGMQLYWYEDLPADERMSAAAQVLALEGIWPGDAGHLRFAPEDMVSAEDLSGVASKAAVAADDLGAAPRPRGTLALQLADRLKLL